MATLRCPKCELERLNDSAETFYKVLAQVVPLMGLTTTERRVEPARNAAIKELGGLVQRRNQHVCTHRSAATAATAATSAASATTKTDIDI